MPAITVTDLNNAKTDVDHIAAVATSTAATATDRLGGVKKTMAGITAEMNAQVAQVTASRDTAVNTTIPNLVGQVQASRDTAVNTTIPAAVASVDATVAATYVGQAQAAKNAAEAAKTQSETYAALAATGAKFYDTIALGRAAVADTFTFGVKAGGSDGLTRATVYRRDSAGTQTLLFAIIPGSEYDALFPQTTPSGYAWAILDVYGKASFGVLSDGTLRAAYLSADTMTATTHLVGTDSVKGEAPYGYAWALCDAYGKALLAAKTGSALELPDVALTRVNGVPAYLVARRARTVGSGNFAAEICHVMSYGQSLSIGATANFIQTLTQPSNAVMFNAGVRAYEGPGSAAANRASLVALVENYNNVTSNGETPCGQFAAMTMRLIEEENGLATTDHSFKLLMSANGIANTAIASLKTVAGGNLDLDVQYGLAAAQALGSTYNVPAVLWTQGTNDITGSTSQASYAADMATLYTNINNLVKGLTGQTNDIKLICSQPFVSSAANPTYDSTNVGMAMIQAAAANQNIIIACPEYCYDHQPANVHLTSTGSGAMGGKYGEVYKRVVVDSGSWTPLGDPAQITATRQSQILTLTFNNVQRGPLVLDTTLLAAVTNSGFILKSSGGVPRTINSVAIAGANVVKIVVAAGLAAGDTIEYGFTTFGGNLRDSEGSDLVLEQRAKRPMHNWCIGFKKTIT